MRRGLQVIGNALREEVTAEGLRRYYRDMSRRFWPRLILAVLGSLAFAALVSWWGALIVLFGAGGADVVEERLARRIRDRPIREDEVARLRWRSFVQGVIYSAAVCVVASLIWQEEVEGASLLAIVIVLGSAFEAGFMTATNRLVTLTKIALYALTAIGNFAAEAMSESWSWTLSFELCALAILGYCVVLYMNDVRGARRVQARAAAALAERGEALESALAKLTEKERAMRRFALAAEHAHDSIVITGPDSRIVWVNGGFTARTGWTLADVSDRPSRLMADPDNDPATLGALNFAIEARRPFRGQLRVWCRGDRWVWYDVSLTPLFDEDGRFESYISVERDISELKAREAELARQEAEMRRLALVAEHARDAVVLYSPDGRIEWVNAGFTIQTGYAAHEVVGRRSGMLVPSPEDSVALLRIRAAMAAERAIRAELRLSRKDGALFWCEISLSPVHGEDGALKHYVGVERDISELKAREAELAEKERENRRLALVAEHSTDSIMLADARGYVEWINSALTAESGYGLSDVKGRHLRSFIAPESDPAAIAGLDEAAREERTFRTQLLVKRPGGPVWHDVIATPIHDEDGVLRHWITVERDITEAKAREGELAEKDRENRRLALVARHTSDCIVLADAEGLVEWVNAAFTEQTGWSLDEVRGWPLRRFVAPDADPAALVTLQVAVRGQNAHRTQLRLLRRGASVWCDLNSTPIFDEDGTLRHWISAERDITEVKAREAELAQARQAAEAAAEAKSSFLATMSHEIRTPMNGIIGTADLLAESALDDDQRRLLRTIAVSSEALLKIINDILDLSKLDAERVEMGAEAFAPAELAEVCAQLLRPLAERKGLALAVTTEDVAARLVGDPGRLQQIVLNLLGNAIKFTEGGRVELRVGLEPIDASGQDGERRRLRIAVADTGIGIEPDRLDGVFDAFTQADGTITRRFGGTGLGLSISRKLAHAMGGDLSAASTPGEGSTFTLLVDLPLAQHDRGGGVWETIRLPEDDAPAGPQDDARLDAAGRLDPARHPQAAGHPEAAAPPVDAALVLLVEDNATNRFLVQRMLDGAGVRIAVAEDGAEGVAAFERLAPDVVIMDVSMPVMDGLEATRRIRAIEGKRGAGVACPILALTANAHMGDRARGEEAGVTAFLTKPIRKADLRAAVAAALRPEARGGAWPEARDGAVAVAAG